MAAGGGKAGSPAPEPTTSTPWDCSCLAFASMAKVADGATPPTRREIRRGADDRSNGGEVAICLCLHKFPHCDFRGATPGAVEVGAMPPGPPTHRLSQEVHLGRTRDSRALATSRRPFRVRTVEGPDRIGGSARGRSTDLPRDEPPPGACSKRGCAGPFRPGRALRFAGGLRGRAGKRRYDGLLGRRHVLSRRGEEPAPVVRRILLQVR